MARETEKKNPGFLFFWGLFLSRKGKQTPPLPTKQRKNSDPHAGKVSGSIRSFVIFFFITVKNNLRTLKKKKSSLLRSKK